MKDDRIRDALKSGQRMAIMCIGNSLCKDDGAGMFIAEKIRPAAEKAGLFVFACASAPENFTGAVRSCAPEAVLIIDAAHMGKKPGTIEYIEPEDIGGTAFSTHMLPLKFLIDYMKAEFACDIHIIGIEPEDCSPGVGMGEKMKAAADRLSNELIQGFSERKNK